MDTSRGNGAQARANRARAVAERSTIRANAAAFHARQRLRVLPDRPQEPTTTHEVAGQEAEGGATMKCGICGPREQADPRSRLLTRNATGVVTCHRLACGHGWHRTIPDVGGIFPGLVRNATFAPCDCPEG